MDTFKVLSLDGGGARGYLTILILERIEKQFQKHFNDKKLIGERFDLIVGTSTGGIIAAGLAIGKSATEIRNLYEELLNEIFKQTYKGFIKPKYNQETLKNELQKILKDKTFQDVKTHLCLTSVDVATSKPRLFKSPYLKSLETRADEKLIDAVLATSAAPVFFPLVDTKYLSHLADGGLVANNPTMIGITDAYRVTNDLTKIRLLSIGTGKMVQMPYEVNKIKECGGILSWALNSKNFQDTLKQPLIEKRMIIPLIEVLLNSQSSLINAQANLLLKDNFIRINPALPTPMDLDDVSKLDILKNLATEIDKEKTMKKILELLT